MPDYELRQLFSNNLKYLLSKNDKTQADLRKYMGVSSATVSDWCNGQKIPRTDKIMQICQWFGVELPDLLTDKQAMQTPTITPSEQQLLSAYRTADDLTKQMILRLLGLEDNEKENASA